MLSKRWREWWWRSSRIRKGLGGEVVKKVDGMVVEVDKKVEGIVVDFNKKQVLMM